jgi:hypothetical protein
MNKAMEALDAWDKYQADMRPETRNNFLRAYAKAHEQFRQALTPPEDAKPPVSPEQIRKAREEMPDQDQHERVIWRWYMKNFETIRALLDEKGEMNV